MYVGEYCPAVIYEQVDVLVCVCLYIMRWMRRSITECMCACVRAYVYSYIHDTYVCLYIYMCVCVCVYIYIYMYTRIHAPIENTHAKEDT
jgi:hypothetical protein